MIAKICNVSFGCCMTEGVPMGLFKKIVLEDSIEINTTPEKIWMFFINMENNYTNWHSEHVRWYWKKGKPLKEGSTLYVEEKFHGKIHKIKAICVDVETNKRFSLKMLFPISFVCPKLEYIDRNEKVWT